MESSSAARQYWKITRQKQNDAVRDSRPVVLRKFAENIILQKSNIASHGDFTLVALFMLL